ncbi:MAG: LPS assembly protein LptD, partial [Candidatus Omnitrophica bacterium]|nr:LPS assembly protein LptD [Candidatus Omnitrophota bacterium]
YRLQYRTRWDVDADTLVTADVEKFSDRDFRRDFLFREEFENATTPDTYVSLIRTQPDYTFSTLVRKRVNRFDTISERLPEVKLDLARRQVGPTPLYYDGEISGGGYTNKRPSPTDSDDDVLRFDTVNELSYPFRWLGFLNFTPRASLRETFYSKDKQGDGSVSQPRLDGDRNILRTVWTTGVDFSTKFYRIFNLSTNALGLDVHGLRHVVTPSVAYTFSPEPPIHADLLQQFDGVDSLSRQNTVTFSLENKLQTKRTRPVRVFGAPTALTHEIEDRPTRRLGSSSLATTGSSVDLARLILSVPYQFIGSPDKGGRFNNVTADLEVQPSAWMRFESDLTYNTTLDKFSLWNFDWVVTPNDRWYAGWGHRFSREDKTESTVETGIRLSEKWWLGLFGRFTYKEVKPDGADRFAKRFNNLRERQIVLSRDLHDWILEVTYRVDREFGEELYFTMRLKAFPDQPFEVKESYHQPKIGSQSSPFSPVARQ